MQVVVAHNSTFALGYLPSYLNASRSNLLLKLPIATFASFCFSGRQLGQNLSTLLATRFHFIFSFLSLVLTQIEQEKRITIFCPNRENCNLFGGHFKANLIGLPKSMI